jgi:hypothetical protein
MELADACSAKELADKDEFKRPHEALAVEYNGNSIDSSTSCEGGR